jgi:uncharacterized protein (UPF0371 family)
MPQEVGFDNELYLDAQLQEIRARLERFPKLYLEFGGKLIHDYHAARVLPGYDPNVKMRLLRELQADAEIIVCIHAGAIDKRKIRADFGLTYDADALKLIDDLRAFKLAPTAVVITRYANQPSAELFKTKLERRGLKVYLHKSIEGYPNNISHIVSDNGYGSNPHIETTKPLVIITAPGPGSGKLATCLGQLYHDHQKGIKSGYSKFETFPIWNLPVSHPVNIAYEAATADLQDFNLIDPHHLEKHGITSTNYNRDVAAFPLLKRILELITEDGSPMFMSSTDMGVNQAGLGIIDHDAVKEAAKQEVVRRYYRYLCEFARGFGDEATVQRASKLMANLNLTTSYRTVVEYARNEAEACKNNNKGNNNVYCGAAIQLHDKHVVGGKNSPLMHAAPAAVLNTLKYLAGIKKEIHLLSLQSIESVRQMKINVLGKKSSSLDLEETLVILATTANDGSYATQQCMNHLSELKGCEAHLTHLPTPGDEEGMRRLGLNMTSDPVFANANLLDE